MAYLENHAFSLACLNLLGSILYTYFSDTSLDGCQPSLCSPKETSMPPWHWSHHQDIARLSEFFNTRLSEAPFCPHLVDGFFFQHRKEVSEGGCYDPWVIQSLFKAPVKKISILTPMIKCSSSFRELGFSHSNYFNSGTLLDKAEKQSIF